MKLLFFLFSFGLICFGFNFPKTWNRHDALFFIWLLIYLLVFHFLLISISLSLFIFHTQAHLYTHTHTKSHFLLWIKQQVLYNVSRFLFQEYYFSWKLGTFYNIPWKIAVSHLSTWCLLHKIKILLLFTVFINFF